MVLRESKVDFGRVSGRFWEPFVVGIMWVNGVEKA